VIKRQLIDVALMERQLIATITAGAHLSPKKWREAASSFYSSSQMCIDVFQANEEKAIRRFKEKFAEKQKRICETMGWRDHNQGSLEIVSYHYLEVRRV